MKKQVLKMGLCFGLLTLLSSCEVIGGIFKAGMGVGIFIVVFIIAVVIYFISRFGKK